MVFLLQMAWRSVAVSCIAGLLFCAGVLFAQKAFREYPAFEYNNFPIPPDYQEKTEWVFARLMYPTMPGVHGRSRFGRFGIANEWRLGGRGATGPWTIPAPTDTSRRLCAGSRASTRDRWSSPSTSTIATRTIGRGFMASRWVTGTSPTPRRKALREYLLRGGFFMCDDFHGTEEWDVFTGQHEARVSRPARSSTSRKSDAIFHVIYDLGDRYQVPGEQYVRSGDTYEYDGYDPHWRGIYDDHGRVMVAICNDMDLGDSWEHADNPEYPAQFSGTRHPHRRQLRDLRDEPLARNSRSILSVLTSGHDHSSVFFILRPIF